MMAISILLLNFSLTVISDFLISPSRVMQTLRESHGVVACLSGVTG